VQLFGEGLAINNYQGLVGDIEGPCFHPPSQRKGITKRGRFNPWLELETTVAIKADHAISAIG